jgi:formate-dependent nitrite reductase membrane component NrfD
MSAQQQDRPGGAPGTGHRRRGGRRRGEQPVVPDAQFTSYYGRPVVKPAPWHWDIPGYLFFGGLASGSSLLAVGADLTGRPALRRASRIAALGTVSTSLTILIQHLGRPSRAFNMFRVLKPTSPMSVGTWAISAMGPGAGIAAAAEVADMLPVGFGRLGRIANVAARPAGMSAAVFAPAVATYTGVLLANTATPAWHAARKELPIVFAAAAAASSGGLGMITAPASEAAPARRLAVAGAAAELIAEQRMEHSMGLAAETLHAGLAGRLSTVSKILTAAGALGGLLLGRRSRLAAALSGTALLAGAACNRYRIFSAGQESAKDPKYTVVPQRERLNRNRPQQSSAASSTTH